MQPIRRTARHSIPGVLALAGLAFGGGCGDPVVDPPVPATITITPTIDFLLEDAGRTVQLTAIVRDRDRHVITTVEVAWSSSDSNIVEVSETGLVTGGEPGKATVQASVGPLASAANITVAPGPRAVLYKFYREMGGDDWVNNRDWRKDTPYHMWYGVKIDTLGSITGLWLPYNELAGPIPPELGMLRGMRDLWLSWNRVTGPMPPELGNLWELEWLRLEHNELTGSIPPELGNLRNLLSIQLYDNELTGSIPEPVNG
ncbi:MAG: Ig-like domain-containing protein [Gemmatimonadota bacterium]|nr:Ig-like domain-containing protein [Gemmatimonadota bacterium]